MASQWDKFLKSLAEETVPRRESLRRIAVVLGGAVLSPLGLGTAWARGSDLCRAYCDQFPKWQRTQCRTACRACYDSGGHYCGTSGAQICCGGTAYDSQACCGGVCGHVCPWGTACISGVCDGGGGDGGF